MIQRTTTRLGLILFAWALALCLTTNIWAQTPKMKMTTEIPPEITIADKVETSIGTLTFADGFPSELHFLKKPS